MTLALLSSAMYGQIACPYPVTNNLDCEVEICWESFEANCVLLCSAPGGCINTKIAAHTTAYLGTGGCCDVNGDITIMLGKFDPSNNNCNAGGTSVSGGSCNLGTYASSNIISPCDGITVCNSNSWTMTWTSTEITIDP